MRRRVEHAFAAGAGAGGGLQVFEALGHALLRRGRVMISCGPLFWFCFARCDEGRECKMW